MDDVLISVVFENLRQFCKKFTFFQLMTFDLNSNTASFLYFCMNHEVFASLLLCAQRGHGIFPLMGTAIPSRLKAHADFGSLKSDSRFAVVALTLMSLNGSFAFPSQWNDHRRRPR